MFYTSANPHLQGKLKDANGVIGSRKSQDRQYNGKEKLAHNDKQWSST
jgi:hypothetical protein